jgi:ribosomal protein S20
LAALAANEAPKTQDAYRAFCSALDKAVKHGIIAKNNSIRRKARAAAMLRKAPAK